MLDPCLLPCVGEWNGSLSSFLEITLGHETVNDPIKFRVELVVTKHSDFGFYKSLMTSCKIEATQHSAFALEQNKLTYQDNWPLAKSYMPTLLDSYLRQSSFIKNLNYSELQCVN